MKKESIKIRRLRVLQQRALTRNGAMDIANYFINTVSWNKLKLACEDLDIKV